MRQRASIGAVLLVVIGVALGATVFRSDIAQATGLAQSVTVDNTATNPVPVREQNLDGGNIKVHEQGTAAVHEQGTANVNVTNNSVPITTATVTGGGGKVLMGAGVPFDHPFSPPEQATALSIAFHGGAQWVSFSYQGSSVAEFWGPAFFGPDQVQLALSRPITFDETHCQTLGGATDTCNVSWIGAQP